MIQATSFDNALESVESLSYEDQEALIAIIQRRLVENRRAEIAVNIAQSKAEYQTRKVFRGTVEDVIAELDN
jgi:hypothetical protein